MNEQYFKAKPRHYVQLTLDMRLKLQRQYEQNVSIEQLAKLLGCSRQTIYNELQRGYTGEVLPDYRDAYCAKKAQRTALLSKKSHKKRRQNYEDDFN